MSLPATRATFSLLIPTPTKLSRGMKMHSNFFRTYGPKVGRLVDCYSEAEWRFLLTLEADPNTRTYCEKFPKIDEAVNGRKLFYIFSFWVRRVDGAEELIGVHRRKKLTRNQIGDLAPERWDDVSDWCVRQSVRCRFVTDMELNKVETLTNNWAQILPHVQRGIARQKPELAERILGAVRAAELRTIDDLAKVFPNDDVEELQDMLFVLVHQGRIFIDLQKEPVTRASKVEIVREHS